MSEYTPDTEQVREAFATRFWDTWQMNYPDADDEAGRDREGEAFDRWLAEERRKAKAEAWEECAAVVEDIIIDLTGDIEPHERMLANPYREEEHSE